ncbi:MAG: site-2 protease family protein [Pirellulales bacterium]
MSDSPPWSLYLARLRRVHLRFHALFLAVAVFALFLSTSRPGEETIGYGVLAVAVLFASVLAHEAAHCCAAVRVGGNAEQVLIGPLGGLAFPEVPREPQAEFITAVAGPIVNLAIVLLALPILLVAQIGVSDLLSPLQPTGLIHGSWGTVALKLAFWINWLMLLVNLLPAFPFDGARVLRALLWPALDYRGASLVAVRISKLTAIGVCILAWLVRDAESARVLPTWVPLALFAVFVFTSASAEASRIEEADWEEELLSYDFSQGYTSLERTMDSPRRPAGSPVRRWLENRREMRRRRQRWQEQDEERQVDAILVRLHETGLEGLTAKERALLQRVSARYRNRQGS